MIYPSHNNSANERNERRMNWKQNLQAAITPETATTAITERFAVVAAKFISTGAVSVDGNRTFIQAGKRHYTVYQIKGVFACECSDSAKYGVCAHKLAAEKFHAAQISEAAEIKSKTYAERLTAAKENTARILDFYPKQTLPFTATLEWGDDSIQRHSLTKRFAAQSDAENWIVIEGFGKREASGSVKDEFKYICAIYDAAAINEAHHFQAADTDLYYENAA